MAWNGEPTVLSPNKNKKLLVRSSPYLITPSFSQHHHKYCMYECREEANQDLRWYTGFLVCYPRNWPTRMSNIALGVRWVAQAWHQELYVWLQ